MEGEDLEERHKKERKELHNKIQALKHGVPKGDKKRKKEVNAEIAKLQAELDERHKQELQNVNTVQEVVSKTENLKCDDDGGATEESQHDEIKPEKISRAQKRRDKKLAEEKAREKRLQEGEKESVNHARNIEAKQFEDLLHKEKLEIVEVEADGDCLYNAVSMQLQNPMKMDVDAIRHRTSNTLLSNVNDYIMFTTNAEGNMLTHDEYEKYCNDIKNTKAWGGQLELKAITQIVKRPIKVYQAGVTPIEFGEEFNAPPILLSYHRHQYGLGEHYNALKPENT